MPHRGRKRKKSRTQNAATGPDSTANTALETTEKIPKSLVFRKGKTVAELAELVTDLRKLMQPYTAIHFQEDARNRKLTLQQYATHLALPLGMTHLLQISQSPNGNNSCSLKIARLPAGPVLHFKIRQFSLNRHIRSKQKRPIAWTPALSSNSPVVVTHQFLDTTTQQQQQQQPHLKLLQVTFQNMFPTLNVSQVQLQHCKRVVLFQRELVSSAETDTDSSKEKEEVRVTMRHYAITTRATGIAAPLRRLARGKIPNLTHVRDIAEYMEQQHATKSSYSDDDDEEEDDGAGSTVVTSASGTTTTSSTSSTSQQQRALKLVELGPRLDLSLMGVTTGLDTTTTDHPWLWHATKTPEELARLSRARQQRSAAVAARRSQQEANVAAKQAKKDAKAQRRKERREEKEEESGLEGRKLKNEETIDGVSSSSEEEEDDEGESDPE